MTGWRNWPNFNEAPYERQRVAVSSWWLPEPLSIVTVPQPHRRADSQALPPSPAGRPIRRGRLATAAAVPDTHTDWRWLIPAAVLVLVCLAVKWWSERR